MGAQKEFFHNKDSKDPKTDSLLNASKPFLSVFATLASLLCRIFSRLVPPSGSFIAFCEEDLFRGDDWPPEDFLTKSNRSTRKSSRKTMILTYGSAKLAKFEGRFLSLAEGEPQAVN